MSSLRLTAYFAILVGLIIMASGATIFYSFKAGRTSDYVERLRAEGWLQYKCFRATGQFCQAANELNAHNLQKMRVSLYDVASKKRLLNLNGGYPVPIPTEELPGAVNETHYHEHPDYEALEIRVSDRHLLVIAARNNYGLNRMMQLKYIIFWVCLGAIVLVAAAGWGFSRLITLPLIKFNEQMQRVTVNNLTERLGMVRGRGDLNTTASAFNEMIDRLQQAFEFQRSFVHHASHELRTPLASMLAHTEAALNKNLSAEEANKVLHSLREDQRSMIDLTNSLLLLSQYEKMQAANEDWPVLRLDELVMEVIEQFNDLQLGWQIRFGYDSLPESEEAFSFRGNDQLIKSALRNLLKNAGNYSQKGEVSVLLKAAAGQCSAVFENNGSTLTDEEQQRLFIPFFRGANAMGKKGFGLGMSIVRRVALLHFGEIHYRVNESGKNEVALMLPTIVRPAV